MEHNPKRRTAAEAGWRLSQYNITAKLPEDGRWVIVNLMKGSCRASSWAELIPLSMLDRIGEDSPLLLPFKKGGILVNYDEKAALQSLARSAIAYPFAADLTVCPTMACNFDCPYCFEKHTPGKMSAQIQDDVIGLAERMLDASGAKKLQVTWFGGEPLLAMDAIEALSRRLMELADRKNAVYEAEIVTNGYLLDQKNAGLLRRCKVNIYQITLDGIGVLHDMTRHLAGGGPTFERITENLRQVKIEGTVNIRHNVYAGNRTEANQLRAFVDALAQESGNDLRYYPALVSSTDIAEARGSQVDLLCGEDASSLLFAQDDELLEGGRGHYCGAQCLWSVGIDAEGRLQKCWEDLSIPEHSFGTAARWDPKNPLMTAGAPDRLTAYLNTAGVPDDGECRSCIWFPACRGGCPTKRLFYRRQCLPYKDDPEAFALAVYRKSLNANSRK